MTEKKKTNIGGQALIEGIMMKGPTRMATAVRMPDGEIKVKTTELSTENNNKLLNILSNLPIIRGSFKLISSMVSGIKELMYSASFSEELEEDALDKFLRKVFKDKADKAIIYFSLIIALLFSVVIFMLGPSFLTNLLRGFIESSLVLNLIEGVIRVVIFVIYIKLTSKLEDIKRVFMYHGAEHKTIYCYENGEELTVENVRKYSTLHPRCGTSFIVNVLLISIVMFSFFGWPNPLLRAATRILMLPVIAGIAYEINRFIGGLETQNVFSKIITYPGFLIQKITTSEPDDSMLEVAIAAMKEVIPLDSESDKW